MPPSTHFRNFLLSLVSLVRLSSYPCLKRREAELGFRPPSSFSWLLSKLLVLNNLQSAFFPTPSAPSLRLASITNQCPLPLNRSTRSSYHYASSLKKLHAVPGLTGVVASPGPDFFGSCLTLDHSSTDPCKPACWEEGSLAHLPRVYPPKASFR